MTLEELNRKTAGHTVNQERALAVLLWLSLRRRSFTNKTNTAHFIDPRMNPELFEVIEMGTAMAKQLGVLSEFRTLLNDLPIIELEIVAVEGKPCKKTSSKKSTVSTPPYSQNKRNGLRVFGKRNPPTK